MPTRVEGKDHRHARAEHDVRLVPGDLVGDRLVVQRHIGGGGLGEVYEVLHKFTRHRRALKVLRPHFRRNAEVVERFLLEASAAGRIGNPHVVETFDAGFLDDGSPFIVMEFLEGKSLNEVLKEHGSLEHSLVAALMVQVAAGVQAAHDAGVIHRDLKPGNLFLTERDGKAFMRVLDFGISKFEAEEGDLATATRSGITMGTPAYTAPEQLENAKDAEVRSDVYSLGVVAYQLISGNLPFSDESFPKLAIRIFDGRHPPLHEVVEGIPRALSDLVDKAMNVSPRGRFQSARALAEVLERFAQNRGVPELLIGAGGALRGSRTLSVPTLESGLPALSAPGTTRVSPPSEPPGAGRAGAGSRVSGAPLVEAGTNPPRQSRVALWLGGAFVAGLALVLGGLSFARSGSPPPDEGVVPLASSSPDLADSPGVEVLDAGWREAEVERAEVTTREAVQPELEVTAQSPHPGAARPRRPRLGPVDIACQPVPCTVLLDGKPLGETPLLNRQVPVGSHSFVMVNSETGLSKTRVVEVRASTRTKLIVTF